MALTKSLASSEIRTALSRRVVEQYRRMCRNAKAVVTMYSLEHTPAEVRHMVMLQFRKNNAVTDPRIIDLLLAQGEMELQETVNQWKQRGHLMFLLQPEVPPADPLVNAEEFFRRFLDGSLDDAALWRGHRRAEQRRVLGALAAKEAESGKDALAASAQTLQ